MVLLVLTLESADFFYKSIENAKSFKETVFTDNRKITIHVECYAGYTGAFKCMADGAGDVAFVKHTTTAEVIADGQYGSLNDYEYLCNRKKLSVIKNKQHQQKKTYT